MFDSHFPCPAMMIFVFHGGTGAAESRDWLLCSTQATLATAKVCQMQNAAAAAAVRWRDPLEVLHCQGVWEEAPAAWQDGKAAPYSVHNHPFQISGVCFPNCVKLWGLLEIGQCFLAIKNKTVLRTSLGFCNSVETREKISFKGVCIIQTIET